jgi:hypothetical protein
MTKQSITDMSHETFLAALRAANAALISNYEAQRDAEKRLNDLQREGYAISEQLGLLQDKYDTL